MLRSPEVAERGTLGRESAASDPRPCLDTSGLRVFRKPFHPDKARMRTHPVDTNPQLKSAVEWPQACRGSTTCQAVPCSLRGERLRELYGRALTLLLHESRLVLDRGTSFLSTNAILFAGFTVLTTRPGAVGDQGFRLALSVFGLVLCLTYLVVSAQTLNALEFWRGSLALIEDDPDYWYPGRTLRDEDLDLFHARARDHANLSTKQHEQPVQHRILPRCIHRLALRSIAPNQFYAGLLPAAFASLWLGAFTWSCFDLAF